eukprot:g44800.t1
METAAVKTYASILKFDLGVGIGYSNLTITSRDNMSFTDRGRCSSNGARAMMTVIVHDQFGAPQLSILDSHLLASQA